MHLRAEQSVGGSRTGSCGSRADDRASIPLDEENTLRQVTYVFGDSLPYTDTSNPFVAAYRDSMAQYQRGQELHQWGLEAWAMAQMLQDYLVAAGPAPTRAGFMEHLNALQGASPAGVMTPTIQYGGSLAPVARDCVSVARWDDGAGTWVSAAPFPYCIDDANLFFAPLAEQGD